MSFYHPDYLYYLSALIIPLIIHLFNFKRFKKVYFTNIVFLKDVQQQSKRHSQWRHIVIMILRMLIIASLVLAFAGPHIPSDNAKSKTSDISNVNIFIDNSFSMQARGEEGSLFEEARVICREIALAHKNTDKYRLLTNSEYSFSKPYMSRDLFLDQLEKVAINNSSIKFSEINSRIDNESIIPESKELYIISDFQKAQANIKIWKTDSLNQIYLIPIVAATQGNIFIDSVWVESPVLQPKQNIELHYRIQNQSNTFVEDLPITMKVFKTQKSVQSIDVPEMGSSESVINFRLDSSGMYAARIEIQDYPVVYDDIFYFSLHLQDAIDILIISSEDANSDIATYLKSDTSFIPTFMDESRVDYSAFSNYSTILLNSISNYSSGLIIELKKFVEKGGCLIIIPNSESSINEMNDFNKSFKLPIIEAIDTSKMSFGVFDLQSDEFKSIFELNSNKKRLDENTDLPYFSRKFVAKSNYGLNTEVLLKDELGDALISRTDFEKGKVYNLYFPIDSRLSNFSSHSVFVPIMYNLLRNRIQNTALYYILGNNDKMLLNYSSNSENVIYKMKSLIDSVEFIPQYGFQQNQLEISFQHLPNDIGAYFLKANSEIISMPSFNYNRTESYLSYYNRADLHQMIDDFDLKNIVVMDARKGLMKDILSEAKEGLQLWKLFIIFAISFLIIELLLLRFSK